MEKFLKTLLVGLPMAILGACSADGPIVADKDDSVAEKTEVRYLKVNLVNANGNPSGSRAIGDDQSTDYVNGTEDENKIRTVDFYFYDADKNYYSHVSSGLTAAVDPTTPGAISSVHGFYQTNVPINLVQGEKMPRYVICIINAVNANFYENRSMEEAQNRLLEKFYSPEDGGNKYFSMNNSVYYGLDEVTGQSNQLIMATPFDNNKLLTMTELEKMTEDEAAEVTVDIYVERYAAKVNFSISDDAVKDFEVSNGITLEFTPLNWGVNAYEKEFFFLKSYREATGTGLNFESFDVMNEILFAGWNRPDHFRSFWARTPGYYEDNYPLVADDILDVGDSYPYSAHYQSIQTAKNTIGQSQYLIESTLKGSRLTGQDMPDQYLPLTSIPSVVLVGQYKINGSALSFYIYQKNTDGIPEIYAANDEEISGVETIHDRLLEIQTVVLKKDGNSYIPVRKEHLNKTIATFIVEHPKKEARQSLKVGGDLVTLQINVVNSGFYYYDSETQAYTEINSPETVAKANRLLYQNLGGAHAYINGMTFFSAPIQHWGWYRTGNENYGKAMAEWDWSAMKTGDFGIVRNHIYTIQIDNIAGLGTGIINDTDPLLPPTDKVSYAVKFRVNIQKWATLPVQKWEW